MPRPREMEMLVRTDCTLISTGTELTILTAEYEPGSAWARYGKYPFVPGYNSVGEVIEVGPGVENQWLGKRVASYAPHAAFVITTPQDVRVVPDGLASDEAAFFTIAEIVMNGVRRGGVTWGEAVGVFGLGLLGQFTVRFCHFAGARAVIGIDLAPTRIALLPTVRGIVGVNPEAEDLGARVKDLTRNRDIPGFIQRYTADRIGLVPSPGPTPDIIPIEVKFRHVHILFTIGCILINSHSRIKVNHAIEYTGDIKRITMDFHMPRLISLITTPDPRPLIFIR